jgi:hypothetical protein
MPCLGQTSISKTTVRTYVERELKPHSGADEVMEEIQTQFVNSHRIYFSVINTAI